LHVVGNRTDGIASSTAISAFELSTASRRTSISRSVKPKILTAWRSAAENRGVCTKTIVVLSNAPEPSFSKSKRHSVPRFTTSGNSRPAYGAECCQSKWHVFRDVPRRGIAHRMHGAIDEKEVR